MEEYYEQHVTHSEPIGEDIDKWKSGSASAGQESSSNNNSSSSSGGFDCNICLDCVQEPVVTFCGHLYCWPCIYRWIHSQEEQPQCPVCKAEVSQNTLIPLYGRGAQSPQSGMASSKKGASQLGLVVPQRPSGPGCGVHTLIAATTSSHRSQRPPVHRRYPHHQQQVHHQYPYYSFGGEYPPTSPAFGFAGTTTFHPTIGMFGEMIYARIFGNSQATLYAYPNTYSSARVRRQVMQADRSLSRLSFFFCCCIILCLLLF